MTDLPDELQNQTAVQTLGMIYAEVRQTRVELQKLNQHLSEPQSESETYTCKQCNAVVDHFEREGHLQKEHNAPGGLDVDEYFE